MPNRTRGCSAKNDVKAADESTVAAEPACDVVYVQDVPDMHSGFPNSHSSASLDSAFGSLRALVRSLDFSVANHYAPAPLGPLQFVSA